jgi:hypothetical protein
VGKCASTLRITSKCQSPTQAPTLSLTDFFSHHGYGNLPLLESPNATSSYASSGVGRKGVSRLTVDDHLLTDSIFCIDLNTRFSIPVSLILPLYLYLLLVLLALYTYLAHLSTSTQFFPVKHVKMTDSTTKPEYILPVSLYNSVISFMTILQTRSTKRNGTGMTVLRDISSRRFDKTVRLDAQSNAMDKLLGNKLCPEDIGQPRKILEIGYEHSVASLDRSLIQALLAARGQERGEP